MNEQEQAVDAQAVIGRLAAKAGQLLVQISALEEQLAAAHRQNADLTDALAKAADHA